MARITDATETWSAPTILSADEIWQARRGSVYVTTSDAPEAEDGLLVIEGQAVRLSSGLQVRYRRKGPVGAVIVREVV